MRVLDISFDIENIAPNEASRKWLSEEGYSGAFLNLLNQGLMSQYPQGMPAGKGKILARIQAKLQRMEPNEAELHIEEAEFDILKSVFLNDSATFQIGQMTLVSAFSEAMEKAKQVESERPKLEAA